MDAKQLAQQLQQRQQKNLAFFERYFPSIHKMCNGRQLEQSRLNIDPRSLEVNLLENDKPVYPDSVTAFNENEARQFSEIFGPGKINMSVVHSHTGQFYQGRYFHGLLDRYLASVGAVAGTARPYVFTETIPQIAFLGCGLGQHIEALLKTRKIQHAVMVEHNVDRFLASLYVTDWEELITPFIEDQTRSFKFSVVDASKLNGADAADYDHSKQVHNSFAAVWNTICKNVPFLPVQTVYYVHQADSFYTEVANRLNDEMEPFVNIWGYYDDEVNQLNHVLHNLAQDIPIVRKTDLSSTDRITLVCGNGPSLDEYMPIIQANREKFFVIAAGSATHSLLRNDIHPDFCVILESDYATYQAMKLIPQEEASRIPVIGAAQINPFNFELFSDSLLYMKQETAYARLFAKGPEETITDGTPSASNAALAIALDYNLKHVCLVGMEFGFTDKSQTHSSSAFYNEGENEKRFENFKNRIQKKAYKLETNQFGEVYTTPFYNTGRTHAQRKIQESKRKDVINLSKGATIARTQLMNQDDFLAYMEACELITDGPGLFTLIKKNSRKVRKQERQKTLDQIYSGLRQVRKELLNELETLEPSLDNIEIFAFRTNQLIINNKNPVRQKLQTFIRGAIWHWLFNYYALCKKIHAEDHIELFTTEFKRHFGFFADNLPEHFVRFIDRLDANDPKLKLSVADPEPDIEQWWERLDQALAD